MQHEINKTCGKLQFLGVYSKWTLDRDVCVSVTTHPAETTEAVALTRLNRKMVKGTLFDRMHPLLAFCACLS